MEVDIWLTQKNLGQVVNAKQLNFFPYGQFQCPRLARKIIRGVSTYASSQGTHQALVKCDARQLHLGGQLTIIDCAIRSREFECAPVCCFKSSTKSAAK